ncbi:MAG: metal-dependent transcriptional regulator [Lachnospiraceae bacterium]|nr:metal-dependent transcriptional regulator [Lachnospiraceae bacterium]
MKESGEMYLETIRILSNKKANVRSIDVSEEMGFSKPSVSRAMGILKTDGFITIDENGYIVLTSSGAAIADKIYERHKVLTGFFISLGVTPEIAEDDACKIEHDLSDETFTALKKFIREKLPSSYNDH